MLGTDMVCRSSANNDVLRVSSCELIKFRRLTLLLLRFLVRLVEFELGFTLDLKVVALLLNPFHVVLVMALLINFMHSVRLHIIRAAAIAKLTSDERMARYGPMTTQEQLAMWSSDAMGCKDSDITNAKRSITTAINTFTANPNGVSMIGKYVSAKTKSGNGAGVLRCSSTTDGCNEPVHSRVKM
jgi:hypothetical protein